MQNSAHELCKEGTRGWRCLDGCGLSSGHASTLQEGRVRCGTLVGSWRTCSAVQEAEMKSFILQEAVNRGLFLEEFFFFASF